MNESIPAAAGAFVLFGAGIVPLQDIYYIATTVSGAALPILSTIIMSIVMESFGFFRWAAFNLAKKANGSGLTLFWYTNLLCFLMTMFFNNDGSNLANVIALAIVGLDLNQYIAMMFVPSMLGIGAMILVLFLYFRRSILP